MKLEKLLQLKTKTLKVLKDPLYLLKYYKIYKLYRFSRFTRTHSDLLGPDLVIADSASFVSMYKELFEKEIYRFKSKTEQPCIIDCGANIGLSVLYFKRLYPKAKIVAFEADPEIYSICQENLLRMNLQGVEMIPKAVWHEESVLNFYSEGADGGRLAQATDRGRFVEVTTVRLGKWLEQKVDFLKLDIEGAEFEVLNDVKNQLANVERIFVEYHSFVGQRQRLDELLKILIDSGFRLHINSPGLVSDQPFYERKIMSNMDFQLNIYAFRE